MEMNKEKLENNTIEFLSAADINWINQFVDTTRLTWKTNVQKTLENISTANQLPTKIIKNKRGKMVLGYSIEAINLLKGKIERHPGHFDNGRMVK
jgi:hypothetical protein